jgi:hypothetical protein
MQAGLPRSPFANTPRTILQMPPSTLFVLIELEPTTKDR